MATCSSHSFPDLLKSSHFEWCSFNMRLNKTLLLNTVGKHDYLALHVGKSGCFCGIDLPSRRKEVFTFYGPIFARQQIMVILAAAAAPLLCVLMLLLMLAIFSRVYLAHSLALPQSTRESARRKKNFFSSLALCCWVGEIFTQKRLPRTLACWYSPQ